ncbi:MAG: ethanolamine ammonia-lyase [Pseudozobellia sp.]|nr:ethanolamine ammonia-lyase [Pseudozobellia sp.]MBG47032.1 ethanolamine ammonia-lyase [Pseudozobellia sp.]|tara:strand:+ start:195472 stop:197790 length:2319 start_codon:yes stop_codon:yes gene_type:complete
MENISRKDFLNKMGLLGATAVLWPKNGISNSHKELELSEGVRIEAIKKSESIFSYIKRVNDKFDITLYRQILGAANAFKEGDASLGIAAVDETTRERARQLLTNTKIADLRTKSVFTDEIYGLIEATTTKADITSDWTMKDLKAFVLNQPEEKIKTIMPELTSDCIGCLVKLMTNEELIQVGQKVFNPLSNSNIGSKGYLSARVQPNSPTDNTEDIIWQVFDAWSYAVGDLVLGTNPVSSEVESVAQIEKALFETLQVFKLENTIPNCVLSHIDVQAEVEKIQPGTTGIWFQSLAGTVSANHTFDLSIEKMQNHVRNRKGAFALYAETGQGADFTNGHGAGFDMVLHESRKYGFLRALNQQLLKDRQDISEPWVHVNDVAGFIGPEVFKTKEQLVRCCLEDTIMGKLHGLTIGLDICSTLHMDVSLEDLDWCIDHIMPANPAYLMALPTKNDPMLSYLTTSFSDHVRIREKFGYKVNDTMWSFFKKIEVIDNNGQPTEHFGDPIWVYYQYCLAKGDTRDKAIIYEEGENSIARINERGVPLAKGHGKEIWNLEPELEKQVKWLYEDAKVSLWTNMTDDFVKSIPAALPIITNSTDRKDYVYHPESGEKLGTQALERLKTLRESWSESPPDIQFIISDGLNARALMDDGHLMPYLNQLKAELRNKGYTVSDQNIVIKHGRVRAGYACGETLYGNYKNKTVNKGIVHIIGERPGSGHHNFSAYLTAAPVEFWSQNGYVDHNITKVVSGISDTSLTPEKATQQTLHILDRLFTVI